MPAPGAADLHVHTTHSDGSCSPSAVIHAAARLGLAALAITDHDTLSALAVARPEADRLGVELIGGVELTAEYGGREIHLLGHFVRDGDAALRSACAGLRDGRARRLLAMVERLEALGLRVDLKALERSFPRATLGRRHLADWLCRTGQVARRRDAFTLYLSDGAPADVPKPRLPWDRAIALIRSAGGVAALAHPPLWLKFSDLERLAAAGLSALEVAGPGVGRPLVERRRGWADRLGLVPIAGSDFHSADRPGRWLGSVSTPAADLARLRAAAVG